MLALAPLIKLRLTQLPELEGWDVRTNTEDADRRSIPSADVRCVGAAVADAKAGAVMLAPRWQVILVVRRGDTAPDLIDQALSAVICSLLGWRVGEQGGRKWEPFTLDGITEPMLADEGLVGYQITFATAARYMGGTK